jgi:hypothetical protein
MSEFYAWQITDYLRSTYFFLTTGIAATVAFIGVCLSE